MANSILSFFLSFFFFFFFFSFSCCCSPTRAQTDGMFVFGSSLVDNGRNNFEKTVSRANYMPYGIDYPQGPTGRFSNGKNVIDSLGELLKLPPIPAFGNPTTKGTNVVHGVDHASGGSGILDKTGALEGSISLNEQIRNFEESTLPELKAQLGSTNKSLSNYLFVMGAGGNDLLFNYFKPFNLVKPSIQDFTRNLSQALSAQIQKLYSLGGRKFVLISVYPMGCIPYSKKKKTLFGDSNGCKENLNEAARLFNSQMKSLADVLTPQLPGSQIVYVSSYNIILDIIQDPISKGFNDTSTPCCDVSVTILCKRSGSVCGDRRSHVFFDALHPTETVNQLIANAAFSSALETEVYPINVQSLSLLPL